MARRVALLPATGAVSNPAFSNLTPGLQTYKNTIDRLEREYGASEPVPTPRKKKTTKKLKKRKIRKPFTSPEFVVTKKDLALIDEAADLQHGAKRSVKRKRASKKPSLGIDKRTTLLSLVRRIPDAKKPISTWLK